MSEIDRIRKAFEVGSPFATGMALHELQVQSDAIAKRDARIDDLEAQNEWLKDRLSDLQLPKNSHIVIEDWLVECGMPVAKAGAV